MNTTLETIYRHDIDGQIARYQQAIAAFYRTYGESPLQEPLSIFRAPGRVNLIGEHTDYNHGYVLPVAVDKDVLLLARPRTDHEIHLANLEARYTPFSFTTTQATTDGIPASPSGSWHNYAKGAAQAVAQALGKPLLGFDGLVVGAAPYGVPRGAGLSSSSAFTVVTAIALAHFSKWIPATAQLAHLCSDAEWYVGTRGGIMDQFISLLGQRDHALFLDCRPDPAQNYRFEQVPLPKDYRLIVVDSGVHHHNASGEFNQRVAACRAGVALLKKERPAMTHLRDVEDEDWGRLASALPVECQVGALAAEGIDLSAIPNLSPTTSLKIAARCRHVWHENQRVLAAMEALRADDVATFGPLLYQAHESARDDYEISCPEIEVLVEAAREIDGVVGARMTGAGWGGCMVAVVEEGAVAEFQSHVQLRYQQQIGRQATLFSCDAGPGAGLVMAQVSPASGSEN